MYKRQAFNFGTGLTASAISVNTVAACVIVAQNSGVKCWGDGAAALGSGGPATYVFTGQVGDSLPYVSLSAQLGVPRAVQLASQSDATFTCVRFDDGTLKCFGQMPFGQGGTIAGSTADWGDTLDEIGVGLPAAQLGTGLNVTFVSTSGTHVCALLAPAPLGTSGVKCWGSNNAAQLGQPHRTTIGTAPNQMGDFLPFVALGTNRTAMAVAAAPQASVFVLDDGTVKAVGSTANGIAGLGTGSPASATYWGGTASALGNGLPTINLGVGRVALPVVSADAFTACVLLTTNQALCWGTNTNGQLGLPRSFTGITMGSTPSSVGDALPAITFGQPAETPVQVSAGYAHTCVTTASGRVACFGLNDFFQLGLGTSAYRFGCVASDLSSANVMVNLGPGRVARSVVAGRSNSCALLSSPAGAVVCWGTNADGSLGIGSSTPSVGGSVASMGAALPLVNFNGRAVQALVLQPASTTSAMCALFTDGTVGCCALGGRCPTRVPQLTRHHLGNRRQQRGWPTRIGRHELGTAARASRGRASPREHLVHGQRD